MHLRDRRAGNRLSLERFQYVLDRLAIDAGERCNHQLGRERRDLILEFGELVGDVRGEQIAPGGQHLPELDEDRAEVLQRHA